MVEPGVEVAEVEVDTRLALQAYWALLVGLVMDAEPVVQSVERAVGALPLRVRFDFACHSATQSRDGHGNTGESGHRGSLAAHVRSRPLQMGVKAEGAVPTVYSPVSLGLELQEVKTK